MKGPKYTVTSRFEASLQISKKIGDTVYQDHQNLEVLSGLDFDF